MTVVVVAVPVSIFLPEVLLLVSGMVAGLLGAASVLVVLGALAGLLPGWELVVPCARAGPAQTAATSRP